MKRTCLILGLAVIAACSRKEPEPVSSTPWASAASPMPPAPSPSPEPANAAPPEPTAPAPVKWDAPPAWQRMHSNSAMRKAWYRVPSGSSGDAAEVMVFYFGRNEGGDSEANVKRWIAQFPDAKPNEIKRTQRTANGLKQLVVEVAGTYVAGPMSTAPGPPKPGYGLVAAVVETPAGSYFFKMTGPKKLVDDTRRDFISLLDSVRPS